MKEKKRTRPNRNGTAIDEHAKIRRCLMCGDRFMSEWIGNRICKKCRATSAWKRGI